MDEMDEYQNGSVYLRVKHLTYPLRNEYWLEVGGAMGLVLHEKEWNELCELVSAYTQETDELLPSNENHLEKGIAWLRTTWKSVTRDVFQ